MKKLKVAILGFGRSGRDIHAACLAAMPNMYKISAVVEQIEEWRNFAISKYGCEVFEDYVSLFNKKEIDVVVNAFPSHLHVSITKEFLGKGYHVVCDKPLAKTVAEVDLLTEEARKTGTILNVFQQTHFEPFLRKMNEVIDSGIIGRRDYNVGRTGNI